MAEQRELFLGKDTRTAWPGLAPPACAHLQLGLQQPDVLVLLGQLVQQKGHVLQVRDTVREC